MQAEPGKLFEGVSKGGGRSQKTPKTTRDSAEWTEWLAVIKEFCTNQSNSIKEGKAEISAIECTKERLRNLCSKVRRQPEAYPAWKIEGRTLYKRIVDPKENLEKNNYGN